MNISHRGFTLIELLIGVTLSAILMTGIVVFVSSSLGSTMSTKNILEEGNKNENFEQRLIETLSNTTGSGFYMTGVNFGGEYSTGIFLATSGPNLPITFLGLRTQTGFCDSYSGTATETGTIFKLTLRQFIIPTVQNPTSYTLSLTGNAVFSGSNRIIGTGYPGNTLTASGVDTELSSPSAVIQSGTHLYIADTMNDRVLSYDTISKGISKLLSREDGISKPTSLYFSGNTILIASSGNGEIFSLQDGEGNGSVFSSTFHVANSFSGDTIKFIFTGISPINGPNSHVNFMLTGAIKSINDIVVTGATLQYTLSGGIQNFSSGTTYIFTVQNITPPPINSGGYTVQIDFLSGSVLQYSDTFHYFTKGDHSLESSTGNILKTIASNLIHPYDITGPQNWQSNIHWNTVLGQNPPGEEIVSSLPVRDISFQKTGKILTIRYNEYTHYDCILGKHQIREKIQKILLK